MRKMEELKNIDRTALFNSLFTGKNGSLPKLVYLGPVLLCLVVGIVFLTLPHSFGATIKTNSTNAIANNLQEDINMISQKAEKTPLLDMDKEAIIQESKKKSFLGQKARQQIDKSAAAQSAGQFDEQLMVFDSALNRYVYPPISHEVAATELDNIDDIHVAMGLIKTNRQSAYAKNEHLNQFTDKSDFAPTEAERLERFAAAKDENRRRRAAIDKTQTEIQAEAYQRAIQDNEKRYRHFYGLDEQGQPIENKANTKTRTKKQNQRPSLSFSTAVGAKDNLMLSKAKEDVRQTNTPPKTQRVNSEMARLSPPNQIPLVAVIDQAQKIKSGDKVQLRIIEDGLYQGLFIPKNSIFYGLCQIQKDRIQIAVPSINLDGEVLPARLSGFDADGMEGIYVDGTFNDWTKDAIQEGLSAGNSLGIRNSLGNFSLKLGRKANNRVRVYVPGGYQVFLYESN